MYYPGNRIDGCRRLLVGVTNSFVPKLLRVRNFFGLIRHNKYEHNKMTFVRFRNRRHPPPLGSQTAKTIGAKLLISEAAAADRLTVCSGLTILDSAQNSNYLKNIYLSHLLNSFNFQT